MTVVETGATSEVVETLASFARSAAQPASVTVPGVSIVAVFGSTVAAALTSAFAKLHIGRSHLL
jgi:hypothetical protein